MRFLLQHAVEQAAAAHPESEAVRFGGQSLVYAGLNARANSLAHFLLDRGLRRGDRVGIWMNKCLESAVAIYGIMKAGGVYVPLDPFAPPARVAHILRDCGIRFLVTNESRMGNLPEVLDEVPKLECLLGVDTAPDMKRQAFPWEQILEAPQTTPQLNLTEQDLAYILYTSGSTGLPKGITHTHRSGLSFAEWAAAEYGLRQQDRLSNHAPLHFDLSTFDFFASAIASATTVLVPEALTKFPASLSKWIQDESISVWYSVPFALIQLMQRGLLETRQLGTLRWILFAGEVFPTKHLRQLVAMLPQVRFSNLYGPTETNVCTYYHLPGIPEDTDETIPIGKACANIEDLVVDATDQPVPPGEAGELLIRGGVVMRGYWGQPEKTAAGFFRRAGDGAQEADIFYRTGDLVRKDGDGNYRYLGRKDRQIKTRGYRVELDEIEVLLLAHPAVQEAAVFPIPDGQGSNLIGAAVTQREGIALHPDDLIAHLSVRLPSYALPAKMDVLEDFPRTSTGKIDRRALQAAVTAQGQGG